MDEQRVRMWDEYWRPIFDSARDGPDYAAVAAKHEWCNVRFEMVNGPIYVGKILPDGRYVPWGHG